MTRFPPPAASRPDRSSMSLLVELTTNTVDEGYAEAARRGANVPPEAGRRPRRRSAIIVLAVAGLLLAVAAVQARHRAPATARARASLERDISRQVAATDALDREVRRQRRAITAQRERALAASRAGGDLAGRVATLELAAGQTPVRGPGGYGHPRGRPGTASPRGHQPEPAERPGRRQRADPRPGRSGRRQRAVGGGRRGGRGRRRAADGAKRDPLRRAGDLVDFRPLVPPYVVTAIGPESLAAAFADSDPAARLRAYTSLYGIGFSVRSVQDAVVPGAAGPTLRHARPLPSGS